MGPLISTIGIYGVISFAVARQTKEIGVRMALGARRGEVIGMVLWHGLGLTVIGSAIGLAVALALVKTADSLLYGVSPRDAITFISVPVLLLTVAAAVLPCTRASCRCTGSPHSLAIRVIAATVSYG